MEVEIILGRCPLCDRNMIKNENLEEHHLTPKSLKGKETVTLHKLCHQKIHTVFTERELQRKYNNIKDIRKHIEIQKFTKWAAKKDTEYYIRSHDTRVVKNKKKGDKLFKTNT